MKNKNASKKLSPSPLDKRSEAKDVRVEKAIKEWHKIAKKIKKIPSHSDLNHALTRNMIRGLFGDMGKFHDEIQVRHPEIWKEIEKIEEDKVVEKEKTRLSFAGQYRDLAKHDNHLPSQNKFIRTYGKDFYKYYADYEELEATAAMEFVDDLLGKYSDEDFLDHSRRQKTFENVNRHTRIVVSSIGAGPVDMDYLRSVLHYCEKNDGRLVLQCTDIKFHEIDKDIADLYFGGKLDIAVDNIRITENLELSNIRIKEKVVDPNAGIKRRLGSCSYLFASPKQTFESLPSKKKGIPRFLMSSGAITQSHYFKDSNRPHKREVMADNDHLIGCYIIEKEEDLFFVRQTQRGPKAEFLDWGMAFHSDGKKVTHAKNLFNMGDLHSKDKHGPTFKAWLKTMKSTLAERCIGHDIFDAVSVNPHEINNSINQKINALEQNDSTVDELKVLADDINSILSHTKEFVAVESNHDDMLDRSFVNKSIFRDSRNSVLGTILELYAVVSKLRTDMKGEEVFDVFSNAIGLDKAALKAYCPRLGDARPLIEVALNLVGLKTDDRIKFLSKEASYVYGGFQLSNHGDRGVNGAKGSQSSFKRVIDKMMYGHTHTPAQSNFVVSIGHTAGNPRYARGGFSTWVRTSALVYESGQFQFVHSIFGRVRTFKNAYLLPEIAEASKDLVEVQKTNVFRDIQLNHMLGAI